MPVLKKRVVGLLVLSMLGLSVPTVQHAANASTATVTGTVYEDRNVNGANDGSDSGLSGVTVAAYDSTGARVGVTTSGAGGAYTINVTNAATASVRVEFTTPAGFQPSFRGSGNGTSIQFVTLPASNVNYAVNAPGSFCANNAANDPLAVSTCIRPGPSNGLAGSMNTLTSTRWSERTTATPLLTHSATGATWGIAQDPATGLVWTSAVLRRHAGLGPRGLGGLYATSTQGGSVIASFDIGSLLDQNGNPIRLSADDSQYTDAARGITSATPLSVDLVGYQGVGQVGLGDIDITPDGFLWVTNLYENTVLRIRLGGTPTVPTLGSVTEYTVPQLNVNTCSTAGTITNNVAHPWALEYDADAQRMLVGIVCGRESNTVAYSSPMQTGTGGAAGATGGGAIMELDPAGSGTWTRKTSVLLNRQRFIEGCADTAAVSNDRCRIMNWKGWSNNFSAIHGLNMTLGGNFVTTPRYPQPILADIEILVDGSYAVGLLDRFSMQLGADNLKPTETAVTLPWTGDLVSGHVAGDVQLMCRTGANTWVQELSTTAGASPQRGGCVGVTTVGGKVYESLPFTFNGTVDLGAGPVLLVPLDRQPNNNGHLEFFNDTVCGENLLDGSRTASAACLNETFQNHTEISQGGLAVWPPTGNQELANVAMDARNKWNTGGVRWYEMADGNAKWGVTFTEPNPATITTDSSFMKSSSMGDVEVICDRAPVQIGNRVWIDSNSNGIQDPGEAPVVGATVRLYDASGATVLGTAVTDSSGEYYFSTNVSEAASGNGDNSGGGLIVGAAYRIRMDMAADFTTGGPLDGYALTTANSTSAATDLDTSVDNNALTVSSYPQISVATVLPGVSDHTFDFGYVVAPATTTTTAPPTTTTAPPSTTAPSSPPTTAGPSTTVPASQTTVVPTGTSTPTTTTTSPASVQTTIKVSCGDYVWWDEDRDGIQDPSERGIPDVVLTIAKTDGSVVRDILGALVRPTKTNATGFYSFDNLPPGQYRVTVTPPAGFGPTLANRGSNSTLDSSTNAATSVMMTTDGQRDPTLDFGFFKPAAREVVSVGNLVWKDRNGDGLQGPADRGVSGATLHLRTVDGLPVRNIFGEAVGPRTTGADGRYSFDNLLPGRYVVRIVYPPRHFPTTPNRRNRGMNSSTLRATSLTLQGGQRDATLDFGVVFRSPRAPIPVTR